MENDSTKKEKVELVDLVVAIFEHPDAESWLLDAIDDALANEAWVKPNDPLQVRLYFKYLERGKQMRKRMQKLERKEARQREVKNDSVKERRSK